MKLGPLFPKKEKPSIDQQILEANGRMKVLQRKYRTIIEMELRSVRNSQSKKQENPKAVSKLKNAYYSLAITNSAMECLDDITSTQELCKAMNEMSSVLKLMNGIYGKSDKVNTHTLNKNIKKMNQAGAEEDGGMPSFFKEPIDTLVDDDVVDRLVKGESLDSCLEEANTGNVDLKEVLPFDEEMLKEMSDISLKENSDVILEKSMEDIDELLRNMM